MEERDRYPIGQQDFRTLRERDGLYVDKTSFIEKLVRSNPQYYFLARPRRFGKSLFLSTLRYFFEGERDLFKGLYIDSIDWDWEPYPVLYLDLNTDSYAEPGILEGVLNRLFRDWEDKYGIEVEEATFSQRFSRIIETAHKKTGKKVVILVDEYDKPLVGNLHKDDNFEHYRTKLASLYSNFKSASGHIRMVFLTGVSRLSKLSVFSALNNLRDITFDDDFSSICGITREELLAYFPEGIGRLAEAKRVEYEQAVELLKDNYDGYRFTPSGMEMYNPWSVLNAMNEARIGAFWNATGTATIVAEGLRDADVRIDRTLNSRWYLDDLAGLDLLNADPTALLYQAGYLTIADYDMDTNKIRLKVPNEEVRKGLFKDLLAVYLQPSEARSRVSWMV